MSITRSDIILISFLTLTTLGCGAQLDTAADVKGMFDQPPRPLGTMATEMCADLAKRKDAPVINNFALLKLGNCRDSGAQALGLTAAKRLTEKWADPTTQQRRLLWCRGSALRSITSAPLSAAPPRRISRRWWGP